MIDQSTAVLDSAIFQFNGDYVEYFIYFIDDGYTTGHQITANTSTTLISSSAEMPLGNSKKWEIRGKPKDEVFSLISLSLLVAALGETQDYYDPASQGGNA